MTLPNINTKYHSGPGTEYAAGTLENTEYETLDNGSETDTASEEEDNNIDSTENSPTVMKKLHQEISWKETK